MLMLALSSQVEVLGYPVTATAVVDRNDYLWVQVSIIQPLFISPHTEDTSRSAKVKGLEIPVSRRLCNN